LRTDAPSDADGTGNVVAGRGLVGVFGVKLGSSAMAIVY
jgi:hypothetical protein